MASAVRIERTRRNFTDESNRYDVKRDRLVRCARSLAEKGDATKVSVTGITTAMGITRGLFYYYFDGKEELNKAVADSYVSDLMQEVTSTYHETEEREDAVQVVVLCVRTWLFGKNGKLRPMWHVLQEMELVDYVRQRASEELATFLVNVGLLSSYGKDDEMLYLHARFVAVALLGECRLRPDASVEAITDAACAALRYRKRRTPFGSITETF